MAKKGREKGKKAKRTGKERRGGDNGQREAKSGKIDGVKSHIINIM